MGALANQPTRQPSQAQAQPASEPANQPPCQAASLPNPTQPMPEKHRHFRQKWGNPVPLLLTNFTGGGKFVKCGGAGLPHLTKLEVFSWAGLGWTGLGAGLKAGIGWAGFGLGWGSDGSHRRPKRTPKCVTRPSAMVHQSSCFSDRNGGKSSLHLVFTDFCFCKSFCKRFWKCFCKHVCKCACNSFCNLV